MRIKVCNLPLQLARQPVIIAIHARNVIAGTAGHQCLHVAGRPHPWCMAQMRDAIRIRCCDFGNDLAGTIFRAVVAYEYLHSGILRLCQHALQTLPDIAAVIARGNAHRNLMAWCVHDSPPTVSICTALATRNARNRSRISFHAATLHRVAPPR